MREYIFINGTIFSMDAQDSRPEAILVRDNHIVAVGTKTRIYNQTKCIPTLIDLKGKLLLPAFTDCHTHFVDHASRSVQVNLYGCTSMDEVRARITAYIDKYHNQVQWITGSGWDKNSLDHPEQLNRHFLDAISTSIPISLQSKDFHVRWCNSKALELADITASTICETGGSISKDTSGNPDGILIDEAALLVARHIPALPYKLSKAAVKAAIEEAWSFGLTMVHLMESRENYDLARSAVGEAHPLRLCWHFPVELLDEMIKRGVQSYSGNELFITGGVKIFTDGSLGSQTAYMQEPYPGIDNHGLMRYNQQELDALVHKAASHGIACTIHAIGDRANQMVIASLLKSKYVSDGLLHRIEHVQCIRPEDIARLEESGAYASIQPVHLPNDIPMIHRYWKGLDDYTYPFSDIVNAGIPYGFGSDVPVESNNPFLGIYAALARQPFPTQGTASHTAFTPNQRLSLPLALWGYTMGAAMGACMEDVMGSIEQHKLADLIVLDNLLDAPADAWIDAKPYLTMLNGEIVYSRSGL